MPNPAVISGAVQLLNSLLDSRLIALMASPDLNIDIISVDMIPLIQELLHNDEFVNVDNAWVIDFSNGVAESANPNDYFFLDAIHPSARAHNLIAGRIASSVLPKISSTVPTPPTIFLIFFGALLFNLQRKKIN